LSISEQYEFTRKLVEELTVPASNSKRTPESRGSEKQSLLPKIEELAGKLFSLEGLDATYCLS